MRRASLLLVTPLLAAALAGCAGTSSSSSNANDFSGPRKAVAQVVDDLSSAGSKRDGKTICSSILSSQLEQKLNTATRDCQSIVSDQLKDADSYSLKIVGQSITVTGNTATAKVTSQVNGNDQVQTLRFVRQNGDWRVAGLG